MQGINRRNALKTGLLTAVAAGAGMAHAEVKKDEGLILQRAGLEKTEAAKLI